MSEEPQQRVKRLEKRVKRLEKRCDRLAEILQDFVARCPDYVPPPSDDYPLADDFGFDDPQPPPDRAIIA